MDKETLLELIKRIIDNEASDEEIYSFIDETKKSDFDALYYAIFTTYSIFRHLRPKYGSTVISEN